MLNPMDLLLGPALPRSDRPLASDAPGSDRPVGGARLLLIAGGAVVALGLAARAGTRRAART